MIVYGKNPILEALRANRPIEKVLVAHDGRPPHQVVKLCKERGIKIQRVPRQKIEELAGTKKTQGIVAIISPVPLVPPEEIFKKAFEKNSFFLVLDHITDPQNAGNLIRTCEVFGGVGVLMPKDRSFPINQTVVKASAGAVFHLTFSRVPSLKRALEEFQGMGGFVVVVERGGEDIRKVQFPMPCALVLGSEGEGVSKSLLERADLLVSIPMVGKIDSLNVSSAGVSDFAVRYYLSSANLPKECAPGTFNLLKQVSGDSTGRPIASCIAVFRVRYFDSQSYSGVVDDINNLRAIRLCLLMQVGGRMDTPMDPPNGFEQCGDITTNPEWRWYRWKLVEEDIPLRNIRK
jgi:23S rRNA (guanosine2251-2'-O)-methyltransferase